MAARAPKPPAKPVAEPGGARPDPDAPEEVAAAPVPALVPQGIQPGDDPELRARLESQAKVSGPYWARLAPKLKDPGRQGRAATMFTRLQTLGEPAELLAKEQYALTQEIIAEEELDHKSRVWVDYLNNTSAVVLQGGADPADITTPDQAEDKVRRLPQPR